MAKLGSFISGLRAILWTLSFVIASTHNATSQSRKIDSLKAELKKKDLSDTSRVNCFTRLSQLLLSNRAQNFLTIDEDNRHLDKINLGPYLNTNDLNDYRFVAASKVLDKLPVNKPHIFFITIRNKTDDSLKRSIQFDRRYVTANNFRTISLTNAGKIKYQTRTNHLYIALAPQEIKLVFIKMDELNRAEEGQINLYLATEQYHEQETIRMYTTQAFFLGLFSFLLVFNILIYFVTGWKVYLKYAAYIFCALAYFLYYFGLLQSVFPFINNIPVNLTYTWYSLIFISYFVFLNEFGDYKQQVPRAYSLLNVGIVFKSTETFINTLLHLLGFDFIYSKIYINVIIAFEIVLMFFIVFYIIKNKHPRGKFVIAASLFLILGAIVEQTKMFPGVESIYFVECGVAAELLVFSIGLGYITKLHYEEKRSAELLYIQQLVTNEELQKQNTEHLERTVQQRTNELNHEKLLVEKKNSENELLLAEIHHRVKNNLQVISSLLSLQEKSIKNKNVKLAILEGKERIRSMELVHKMLYRSNSFSNIEMKDYVHKLSEGLMESFGLNEHEVELDFAFAPITLDVDTAIPVGLILNELIINSLKYAREGTQKLLLTIRLQKIGPDQISLYISDNGNGKIEDIQSSNSFGLRIIKALIKQLNGQIVITENNGIFCSIIFQTHKLIHNEN